MKTILKEAKLIEYMEILPAKEACMLKDGNRYFTGSDFTEEELNTEIPQHGSAMMTFYNKLKEFKKW